MAVVTCLCLYLQYSCVELGTPGEGGEYDVQVSLEYMYK